MTETTAKTPTVDRHEQTKRELLELWVRWHNGRPYGGDGFVFAFLDEYRPDLPPWDRWALWEEIDGLLQLRARFQDGTAHWSQVLGDGAPGTDHDLQADDELEARLDGYVEQLMGGDV